MNIVIDISIMQYVTDADLIDTRFSAQLPVQLAGELEYLPS
jgi:hypothetical protein